MAAYGRRGEFGGKTNPFEDDSDDEFEKVNGEDIRNQMQLARERTVESTKRSLALIKDSHDMAILTADELQYQGEKLNRVDRNLDKIQSDMAVANRHISEICEQRNLDEIQSDMAVANRLITSVKSIWEAIGNYFKKPTRQREIAELHDDKSLYFRTENVETESRGYEAGMGGRGQFQRSGFASRDAHERQIDANLGLISRGLGRLKDDALILRDEIGRQNDQLDRLGVKADRARNTVDESDKKVKFILRN